MSSAGDLHGARSEMLPQAQSIRGYVGEILSVVSRLRSARGAVVHVGDTVLALDDPGAL